MYISLKLLILQNPSPPPPPRKFQSLLWEEHQCFLELQINQCVVSEISRVPDHIIIPKEGDPGVCQNSTVEPSFDLLIKNQILPTGIITTLLNQLREFAS